MKEIDLNRFSWLNKPDKFELTNHTLWMQTSPETDFWQRTYYGFSHDNAPAFLYELNHDFSFQVKTHFQPENKYDQCGLLLYNDSENWIKASIEHENSDFARLGSVVTNRGYSDWASMNISADTHDMWYRLSRRGQDFLIENSPDGNYFHQMRILHLHLPVQSVRVGVYACSPLQSSFKAIFSDFKTGPCMWPEHT